MLTSPSVPYDFCIGVQTYLTWVNALLELCLKVKELVGDFNQEKAFYMIVKFSRTFG